MPANIILCILFLSSVAAAEPSQRLETPYFNILYHQDHRSQASTASKVASASYDQIIQSVGGQAKQEIEIVVCSTDEEFNQWTGGALPDWGIGCALLGQSRIVLRSFRRGNGRWREVIVHELAHLVLHQAIQGQQVPRWFHEGVAMWQSQEWSIGRSLSMGVTLFAHGLIPLEEIDHVFSYTSAKANQAYTESFLAITYLHQRAGPDAVRRLVREMRNGRDFQSALEHVCGCSFSAFREGWNTYMHKKYGVLSLVSSLFSTTYFWIGCAGLFLIAYLVKRYRSKKTIERWEREEQQDFEVNIIEFLGSEEDV